MIETLSVVLCTCIRPYEKALRILLTLFPVDLGEARAGAVKAGKGSISKTQGMKGKQASRAKVITQVASNLTMPMSELPVRLRSQSTKSFTISAATNDKFVFKLRNTVVPEGLEEVTYTDVTKLFSPAYYAAAKVKDKKFMTTKVEGAVIKTFCAWVAAYDESLRALKPGMPMFIQKVVVESTYHEKNLHDLVDFLEKMTGTRCPWHFAFGAYMVYRTDPHQYQGWLDKFYFHPNLTRAVKAFAEEVATKA